MKIYIDNEHYYKVDILKLETGYLAEILDKELDKPLNKRRNDDDNVLGL